MKSVFVDAAFWGATVNPRDQWHDSAIEASGKIGWARFVTTDEVLMELLTRLSNFGVELRVKAAETVREVIADPSVKVVPQTRESFLAGLALYEKRSDKGYSMQDCISMSVMKDEAIKEVLTSDRHFEQAGFVILMKHR